MNYNLEIQKRLLKLDELKSFHDKILILKEAIHIADQYNDIDWGFDLRLNLIQQERNTSKCKESFPAFAWILNASDTNEDYFDESEFLWEYKWMFCSAYRNASVPMEQILEIGEDLNRRLEKNGYSKRAYYNVMTGLALHLRDYKQAQKYADLADAELVDEMTNCPACELDTKVEILMFQDMTDEALIKAGNLINKKLTCYSMPFQTFCSLSYHLLKKDPEKAAHFFEKAIEEYNAHNQYDSSVGYSMGLLLSYMHQTDHPDKWEFFEKVADWEIEAEDIHRYNFYKYMAPIMQEGGTVQLNLSAPLPYYQKSGEYDLKQLYQYFVNLGFEMAKQFDDRNKNDNFTRELEEAMR
jgi:hypothetical protein